MAIDRPTFSESWYRVVTLRPRLRSTVQIFRQYYRGQMWYVVRDPSNEQFFRLSDSAYYFVGLLNGDRTVEKVWEACNEHLGDRAPTQREAIELLGQLYTSNLLASELPADAAGMFERYKKRVRREVGGYLQNFLFIRIPLIDPDAFLDRWVKLFGLLFTKAALVLWFVLVAVGLTFLFRAPGGFAALVDQGRSENILSPDNLIWLYLSMAFIKLFHEFGHGFACKKFGRDVQSGGEVHTMGIMFLVFMPVPYVDASNSWALRSKWQRMVVGAAGIFVELAIASVAAIVWSQTAPGTLTHVIAFNIIFIASVSTLLFNGNPLLRFDGYYIMADLLEIANLSQRSKDYVYYVIKKYAYGVEKPRNPAHSPGEKFWLLTYGIVSAVYRVFIYVGILLFIADKAAIVGMLLAVGGVVTWVIKPLGKWMHYLLASPELMRTRPRAIGVTVGFAVALIVAIGVIPFNEHGRAEGVVEARHRAVVHMTESGIVDQTLATDELVVPGVSTLVVAHWEDLELQYARAVARLRVIETELRAAASEPAKKQALEEHGKHARGSVARIEERINALRVDPPIDGTWVSPDSEHLEGAFLPRGTPIGEVLDFSDLIIRVVTMQELGPRIQRRLIETFGYTQTDDEKAGMSVRVGPDHGNLMEVELRVKGRPDIEFSGKVEEISVGQHDLPYPSLSIAQGGPMLIDFNDPSGVRTPEQFFEVRVGSLTDEEGGDPPVFTRQRVAVRFNLGTKPLIVQWWRQIRQVLQRRFHIPIG